MSVRDLPDKTVVRWRDAAGVHRKKTFTARMEPDRRKRVRMAREFEARKVREVKLGLPQLADERKTLRDVVHESFVPNVIQQKAPKTQALYRSLWNAHLAPAFGDMLVARIEPGHIEDWLAESSVGTPTKRKALVLLGQIFKHAQKRRWALTNPCELVDLPEEPMPEPVDPPTPLEVERRRKALIDMGRLGDATLVSVIAYAGLRPFGEALQLTRGDVRDRTLLVRAPKTKSFRPVDILAPLREDLDWWLRHLGAGFPAAPLFPNKDGDFWTLTQYQNWRGRDVWPKVADDPPKNMRHTFVSLLIRDPSYTPLEVARQAGHRMDVQDSTYAHVWAELRGAGSAVEAIREAREQVFGRMDAAEARA